jgi:hypothetical protein
VLALDTKKTTDIHIWLTVERTFIVCLCSVDLTCCKELFRVLNRLQALTLFDRVAQSEALAVLNRTIEVLQNHPQWNEIWRDFITFNKEYML